MRYPPARSRAFSPVQGYIPPMPALADASLTGDERRLLDTFVGELRAQLGEELEAVWLFGSRARAEPPGVESDVDVLVLATDASWEGKERIHDTLSRAASDLDLGSLPWDFSVHVHTPEWLDGRRAIRSFFIAEVDRDKVVLRLTLSSRKPTPSRRLSVGHRDVRCPGRRDAPGRRPRCAWRGPAIRPPARPGCPRGRPRRPAARPRA